MRLIITPPYLGDTTGESNETQIRIEMVLDAVSNDRQHYTFIKVYKSRSSLLLQV